MPFMAEVTQRLPGLRMPRIVMQVCVASITTATPLAFEFFFQQVGDRLGHPLLHLRPPGDDSRPPGPACSGPITRPLGT